MARVVGRAGQSVERLRQARQQWRRGALWVGAGSALLLLILSAVTAGARSNSLAIALLPAELLLLLVGGLAFVVLMAVLEREAQARRGAAAEAQVEEMLRRLPDSHVVMHDVDTGYGNIDHIVIAPHGVFVSVFRELCSRNERD